MLDGDEIRAGLSCDLGFSDDDRDENVRRIGQVALLLARQRIYPIVACISPHRASRLAAHRAHELAGVGFAEIHLDVSFEECAQRDPKGLYASGVLTRSADDYEPPMSCDKALTLQLTDLSVPLSAIVGSILQWSFPGRVELAEVGRSSTSRPIA